MDKNKPSSRVSTRGALKKQANDFMIEFGSYLAKLTEIFNVFSKSVFELFENCAKTENHSTSINHEITELRQKIMSMNERMTKIKDRMTKLEQGCNKPTYLEPRLAQKLCEHGGDTKSHNECYLNPTNS